MRALRGSNVGAVLRKINPIVRGWSAYYPAVMSSEIITQLDNSPTIQSRISSSLVPTLRRLTESAPPPPGQLTGRAIRE